MDEERSELEDLTAGYIARGEAEGLASDAQGIADRAWDEGAHDGMGDVATPDLPPRPTDPEAVGGPFGEGKAAGSSPVSRGRRRLMPVIVAVIVAVLAVGTAAGVMAWRGNVAAKALSDARSRCVDSLAKAGTARDAYMQAVAAASDMKTVKSDQVADPKVVAALASELDAKTPKTPACTAGDADGLGTTADELDAQARWYATHEANVKTASENVGRSRDEKTLGDARKALADKESAARKLLKDSDGKTGDDVARAKLTQAINTAVEARQGHGRQEDGRRQERSGQGHEVRERRGRREEEGGRRGRGGGQAGPLLGLEQLRGHIEPWQRHHGQRRVPLLRRHLIQEEHRQQHPIRFGRFGRHAAKQGMGMRRQLQYGPKRWPWM